jgi:predicted GTPase
LSLTPLLGLTTLDKVLVDWMRKNSKVPLYLAVNKCESESIGVSQVRQVF